MRVFVTGATGFVGTAVVQDLLAAGHQVLGLARDPAKARDLAATGAEVAFGTIAETGRLTDLAASCDGVIHLAFNHDFSRFAENSADDRAAIAAMGRALAGTGKPLIATAGLGGLAGPGLVARETDRRRDDDASPRQSEQAALALVDQGVRAVVMRLPQVHDTRRQGFVSYLIATARARGMAAWVGDGANRWAAVHLADATRLYRVALERAEAGTICHAVGEEGITMRAICETLGTRLGLPTGPIAAGAAAGHFGWLAGYVGLDMAGSSAITRAALDWQPTGPGLLEDLANLTE